MQKTEMKIKHLVQSINTGLNPRSNFVLGEGTNYYVTTKNLDGKKVVLDDRCDNITDLALRKINARSDLKAGDVLFSGIGTIGRTAIIRETPTNWNISESLYSLRPNAKICTDFLFYILNGNKMEDYYLHYQTGSAQKGLRIEDLKNFKTNIFDISTQKRVVAFFEH
jgi:type I restriction enzyme S subunit